jgi:hypothetical protein
MTASMAGIKERSPNDEDDEYGILPRLRHPPEPVYPNIIFLREKRNKRNKTKPDVVRLYQDMIRYSISIEYRDKLQEQKGFKVDDMGRWLLHHNPYLMERYSGSKSKAGETKILKDFRDTIKRYLEHLKNWWIVHKEDVIDAKDAIKTRLYRYGRVGLIIARILEYRHSLDKSDDGAKQEAKNEIFGLIQRRFKGPRAYNSYKEEFLPEFYRKLIEYDNNNNKNYQDGLCDSVINQIISVFEDESIIYDKAIHLDHVLQTILLTPSGDLHTKRPILRNLYLQTLDQLPEDTRKKVMDNDKNLFENKMLTLPTAPPKEWFDNREQNKNNYDTIVLCGTCKNKDCSHYNHYGTAMCDYYTLISTVSLSADDSYSQMDCPDCKSQRSIHIYNTYDDLVDGIRNNSF